MIQMNLQEKFNKIFQKEFIKKSGEHAVVYGTTGSGKTNFVLDLALQLKKYNKETIIWRDYGKESEVLSLAQFHSLKFFHPEGTISKLNFDPDILEHELFYSEFKNIDDILNNLDKTAINVLSMRRYLMEPEYFTRFWSEFFTTFIQYALQNQLPRPLSFVIDEMNNICPAKGQGFTTEQSALSNRIAFNIDNLRAMKTRLVATSQGLTKIKKNVRTQFQWLFFKRLNELIDVDIPRLKFAQSFVQTLLVDQVIVMMPNKIYTDPIGNIPLRLINLKENQHIIYDGKYEYKKERKQTEAQKISNKRKAQTTELKRKNWSNREIADFIGISRNQVYNFLKTAKDVDDE